MKEAGDKWWAGLKRTVKQGETIRWIFNAGYHARDELVAKLEIECKERDEALSDLLDGLDCHDVQFNTGLPIERCVEICKMKRREG